MIRLVVALQAEARPLVERYGLAAAGSEPFPIYRGERAVLLVSGSGKLATAVATSHLHAAAGGERDAAWLHLGLAGHRDLPIGHGSLAHKVIDQGSGESWYPPILVGSPASSATVLTVDRREHDFEGPWMYDTEASGFFTAASRYSTLELVHAFKIVADTPDATLGDRSSAAFIDDLVRSKLEVVGRIADGLAQLAAELRTAADDQPEVERFLDRWSFGGSEERLLRRLLQRWSVLSGRNSPWSTELEGAATAGEALRVLRTQLDELPVKLD